MIEAVPFMPIRLVTATSTLGSKIEDIHQLNRSASVPGVLIRGEDQLRAGIQGSNVLPGHLDPYKHWT